MYEARKHKGMTLENANRLIGTNRDFPLVSSFFIMMLCEPFTSTKVRLSLRIVGWS
jgi:phosphotransacetylase